MDISEQKLAAARLLLGDDLARRLIEDQWNAVNDLSDPYDVENNSTRASLDSTSLAALVLGTLMDAMKGPAMDLCDRRMAAFSALPEDERKAWLDGGPAPATYTSETCAPFDGPEPKAVFEELLEQNAHLQAMLAERFSDTRLVRFEGGQLDLQGSIVHAMAEGLAQTLGHRETGRDLANYVEVRMTHAEVGDLVMTVQRSSGKTPHQLRREAEEELARLKSQKEDQAK